jgi:hypothetical protein
MYDLPTDRGLSRKDEKMIASHNRLYCIAAASVGLAVVWSQFASAQEGARRRAPFGAARAQLATLTEVQADLKLTDAQRKSATEINDKLTEDRRNLFQGGGGGDFSAMIEKLQKLSDEASDKFVVTLDDGQRKRLTEIFVQANGARALNDSEIAESLKATDEQSKKLAEARQENSEAIRDAFQDLQGASPEGRRETFAKLREEGDGKLLAVLTADQRDKFGKMTGEEIEIDYAPLFPGRGGN